MTRQPNGDVWAPFFEMPWARSGKGIAWDGLSDSTLSRYNPWYFERNREFAKRRRRAGNHRLSRSLQHAQRPRDWAALDRLCLAPRQQHERHRPARTPAIQGRLHHLHGYRPAHRHQAERSNQFYSVDYPPLRKLHRDYIISRARRAWRYAQRDLHRRLSISPARSPSSSSFRTQSPSGRRSTTITCASR